MKILPPIKAKTRTHRNGDRVTPSYKKRYSYHWITRGKRSQPWRETAMFYCAGDACMRNAELHAEKHGLMSTDYVLAKLVDGPTWLRFQVTQHLRACGIE